MIEVESLVNAEVERRLADLIPQIREEERSRVAGGGFGAVPAQTSTDDEFEIYVEQLIGSSDGSRFYILLEKLRDNCSAIWEKMVESDQMVNPDELLESKISVFLPAIRRLTLLGMLIIKYNGNTNWFDSIANLLSEIFNLSTKIFSRIPSDIRTEKADSLESHRSHTVFALESLMACYLLIGFELTKKSDIKFSSSFFSRPILIKTDTYGGSEYRTFLLFYQYFYSAPSSFMDVLVEERYGYAGRIPILWGGAELMKKGIFQVNFLVHWHSFLSFEKLDHDNPAAELETVNYFKNNFPNVVTHVQPAYIHDSLRNVLPLAEKIWSDLYADVHDFFLLDLDLAKHFRTLNLEKRKAVFVRFLIEAERQQVSRMFALNRMPYYVTWTPEIDSEIAKIKIKAH